MAVAPVIGIGLSAVGTVSGISQANRQANAQRQSIEAQRVAAQQQYELNKQRFEYSRQNAEQTFARETVIANEMRQNAFQNLEIQTIQQSLANSAQDMQQAQQLAGLDQQVNQLIANAANIRTQTGQANVEDLTTLAAIFTGSDQAGRNFIQRLASTNQDPAIAQQVLEDSLLQQIANFQATQETVTTRNRRADIEAGGLETQADLTSRYRDAVSNFFTAQNTTNRQYQEFVNQQAPSLLNLQHERNLAALEAAKFSNQAELNIANQSAAIQFANQNRQLDAQASSIQSPNILGSLVGLGAQSLSLLNFGSQPQQRSFSFANSGPTFSPTTSSFQGINDINFSTSGQSFGPVITDFTGSNIFG